MTARFVRYSDSLLHWAGLGHLRAVILLLTFCFCLMLPGFFTMQPMDRDEPRFAQATKQMLETGDFVDIRFQNEARHKKPVGIYWLQSATVGLGESMGLADARRQIWLYRVPSLIGALSAVLFAYWAFIVLVGQREAVVAALIFAATIVLGIEARLAKTDAAMCATAMATMAVLARSWMLRATSGPNRLEILVFWLALGISFLLKGPVIMMVIGLAAAALTWREKSWAWLRPLGWWPAIIFGLAIVLPWFLAIAIKSGGGFFAESLGKDMLGKVGQGRESHWGPPGAYLVASLFTFWPASALILLAIPYMWRTRSDDVTRFCLAWVVPSWLVFEAVPTKLPHYVLPLLPALCLLAVRSLADGASQARGFWRGAAAALLAGVPIVLVGTGGGATAFFEGWVITAFVPYALSLPFMLIGIALAILGVKYLRRETPGFGVVGLAALSAVFVYIGIFAFAWSGFRSIQISSRLAEASNAMNCPQPAIASAGYYEPSLVFLTNTQLRFTDGAGAARFLAERPCRIALVVEGFESIFNAEMEKAGVAFRLAGRQRGFNINGARRLNIGIYIRDAAS